MTEDIWTEVARLVAEYDAKRPTVIKEYRLYYNSDGTIIGLWESSHPEGNNYIVLEEPGIFHSSNTLLMRVQNNKLVVLDPRSPERTRLKQAVQGFRVVKGHAALILNETETYSDIEYYERTNH